MPERQVSSVPNDRPDLSEESQEDFNKSLAEAYRDVDWSEADKVFLRASGLI